MAPSLKVTFIGTATAVLEINGVRFLTDPFFSPAGSKFAVTPDIFLEVGDDPALRLDQLPAIDAVLLSHEDHPDNLDPLGRQLLDGRHVFTTMDGAKNLAPRPAVLGMQPWDEKDVSIAGKSFHIIGAPTKHKTGDECIGFIITGEDFGVGRDGLANAIYFSGDTVYIPELKKMADRYHISAAVMNLGNAHIPEDLSEPEGPYYQITMDGKSAAQLFSEIKADVLIPMHYESWKHFTHFGQELREAFQKEGILDKVRWLDPGKALSIM
ncbi:Metallo-hydrolase/oxidoreductase [Hortaea werneckii]|nr:Metallo-hydrolase/oxidoreductase [Hortaea werneckii]